MKRSAAIAAAALSLVAVFSVQPPADAAPVCAYGIYPSWVLKNKILGTADLYFEGFWQNSNCNDTSATVTLTVKRTFPNSSTVLVRKSRAGVTPNQKVGVTLDCSYKAISETRYYDFVYQITTGSATQSRTTRATTRNWYCGG